ncbi:MAG: hypothetical protein P8X85_04230 [Desulfobacterales bacterium]
MDSVIYFILVPMVYIAFAVFFIGTAVRLIKIFREPKNPAPLQVYPDKKPKWLWALHDTFLFPTVGLSWPPAGHCPALFFISSICIPGPGSVDPRRLLPAHPAVSDRDFRQ